MTNKSGFTLAKSIFAPQALRMGLLPGLFLGAVVTAFYLLQQSFVLHSLHGRQLGIASGYMVDVAFRSGIHWRALGIGLGALSMVLMLSGLIGIFRSPVYKAEARMLQAISITGLATVVILLWQPDSWNMILFQAGLCLLLMAGAAIRGALFSPTVGRRLLHEGFYIPVILLSLAVGCIAMILWGIKEGQNHLLIMALAPCIFLPAAMLFLARVARGRTGPMVSRTWLRFAWVAAPLVSLPALPRVSDEIFFDLNKNGFLQIEVIHVLFVLLGVLFIWMGVRPLILRRRFERLALSPSALLSKAYYPRALFALAVMPYWPAFLNHGSEFFESASICLPISQFYEFGRIPVLEILPPHVFSDFIGGLMHALFTGGPEANDFLAFNNFTYYGVAFAGVFIAFQRVTGSSHLAFLVTALLPLGTEIVPLHFAIGAAGVGLVTYGFNPSADLKRLWLAMGGMLLLVFWKLDVGYPALLSAAGILLLDRLTIRSLQVRWRLLAIAGTVWVAIILLAMLLSYWAVGANPIHNAYLALQYFVSEQSYGYENLGNPDLMAYKIQYFVFLGVAVVMLLVMLLFAKRDRGGAAMLGTAYMLFFYLFNYQRGMVRHNIREDWDVPMHSLIYVGIAGFAWWLARRQPMVVRWIALSATGLFVCILTKFPTKDLALTPSATGNLMVFLQGYQPPIANGAWVPRSGVSGGAGDPSDSEIIQFLRSETRTDQTFLDFSNQPMLYHYARREMPSYFAQTPAMLHNDVLQKDYVKGLTNYDAPIVIFHGHEATPLTQGMDGMANSFRHYRIAEYIYQWYEPWGTVQENFIWKRKGYRASTRLPKEDVFSGKLPYETIWTGHIPHLWAESDPTYQSLPPGTPLVSFNDAVGTRSSLAHYYKVPAPIDKSTGNYIELTVINGGSEQQEAVLVLMDETTKEDIGEMEFTIPVNEGATTLALRVSALATWYYPGTTLIRVGLPSTGNVTLVDAVIKTGD